MAVIPIWALLLLLVVAWFLWAFASMSQVALAQARKGIADGERRQVSILPVIPLFPLVFWGIALLIDQFVAPWGTHCVAGLHLILAVVWLVSGVRDSLKLAEIERSAS